jgi:hypothetical protein
MNALFNTFTDNLDLNNSNKEKIKDDVQHAKSSVCNLLMLGNYQRIMNHFGQQTISLKG